MTEKESERIISQPNSGFRCRMPASRANPALFSNMCFWLFTQNKKAIESEMNITFTLSRCRHPLREAQAINITLFSRLTMQPCLHIVHRISQLSVRSSLLWLSFLSLLCSLLRFHSHFICLAFFTFTFWHSFIYVASPCPLLTLMIDWWCW